MSISYEGIGQWAATFACGQVGRGQMVKISAKGAVSPCQSGERFCGMTLSAGRDGACAVALGGMITAGYTGAAPALGWSKLTADGSGGVSAVSAAVPAGSGETAAAPESGDYLVVDVDETAKTVTFVL